MDTGVAAEEFITIVPVGESKAAVKDPAFVTVLTVGGATGAAEVVVCRPRGARLGLGLKFEGGSAAAEKVRRLLVQSCADDSPAANACTPWGKLIPGDEILAIDGVSVSDLTRIDCVRRLKDSDEALTLLVRHFETEEELNKNNMENSATDTTPSTPTKQTTENNRPTTLPPPVPPRKLGKKNSFKDKPTLQTVGEQNALISIDGHKSIQNDNKDGVTNNQHTVIPTINKLSRKSSFDSHIHRQSKESIAYLKKGSPEEVRRLVRRLSDGKTMPPEAEVYIDLLSNEWERCLVFADAESDDTGSSISTVVDRLGSMTSSVENSIPSTPIMQQKSIDIQKVLNCIENIDTNILKDMTSAKFLERQMDINNECKKLEKNSKANGFANHETVSQKSHLEEAIIPAKIVLSNDKNNNQTITENNTQKHETNESYPTTDKIVSKQDVRSDKPKPMPRNTKVERTSSEKKRRPIPIPETLTTPQPEPLLTPTKKNCIETWLQRSEAEMNNKDDKFEDGTMPEILPRLIDFVPKTKFKESSETPPCTRPTAPPPPPPAEIREDGSGASLDTIGELDESTDVTDNAKPTTENDKIKRKSSFERSFWDDRANKSDAEDKSLSNDETPLPTCPRQPPDGVETPSEAVEKIPDLPSRLPPRLPAGWPNTRPRFSYTSRTQDARSEASVKDKIAMFSTDLAASSDRLDKCGTLPTRTHSTLRKSTTPYIGSYSEVSSLDRRLTKSQDNLDDTPRSYKRHSERPEVLGALEHVNTNLKSDRFTKSDISNKPLFYGSTTTLPSNIDTSFARTTYHARSVSDDNGNKKNTSPHKSNLEYLIEQRKKSMSKLRGLVIPEVQAPIVDLPEIKVQDSMSKTFLQKMNSSNTIKKDNKTNNTTKPVIFNDTKWKTTLLPNNLPKYSPAFKRKSLQVYTPTSMSKESTPERKLSDKFDALSKINNRTVISSFGKSSADTSKPFLLNNTSMKDFNKKINDIKEYKNVEIKICTATDIIDSDNDSAMSSTQSSYRSSASSPMQNLDNVESDSSRLSPRISHYTTYSLMKTELPNKSSVIEKHGEEYIKRNICRSVSSDTNISLSSSAGSAATSGSQASCSSLESSVTDSDKRKVSKSYNIDTINRRNILASAKCRSGRDLKLKSPVVETKFSHESCDRSPSPTLKPSERLSTLTSSVSAVTNKGENRRRSKLIAESDSDSDSDLNIRQRKADYKITRLKRNSSTSNKNKQNDTVTDSIKAEDAPKFIKEKIIKEIKKAGLDNFTGNSLKQAEKINVEQIKTPENVITNKTDSKCSIGNSLRKETVTDTNKSTLIPNIKNTVSVSNKNVNQSVVNTKITTHFVKLQRGVGTGVGLILAGGTDCEAKDVTVHRVLADSVAAKAGLKRGTKIRSINGSTMSGLTHAQSVTILKEQRTEVVIEIEEETPNIVNVERCGSETAESKDCHVDDVNVKKGHKTVNSVVTVLLEKAGGGAGLGFGLDGGRDSPHGDRPLTIKKLFAGGAAAQSGRILVGAELLSAGSQTMEGLTRTQAWAALKALPAGQVALVLRNPKE